MKILMIAPQPFLEPRGTPISVCQRLTGLSRLGHTIDFVTYHLGKDLHAPGVTIHRIPRVPFIRELRVGPSWAKIPLDLLLFFKAFALLLHNEYDVIHSHEEAGFFATLLAMLFHTRHLYDMHSSLPRQLVNFNFGNLKPVIKIFEWLERWTIRSSDAMITIGPDLETYVQQVYPEVNQVMIENLPLQVEADKTDTGAIQRLKEELQIGDRLTVVYTGTFERYQGMDLLVESAKLVLEKFPDVVFLLIGGKEAQIQPLRDETAACGLEESVRFLGTLPVDEANQYMMLADILVSPRITGTSVPLKIYTYLSMAKPILATRLPAHTLVLNDQTATLVEPSADSMAEGFLHLLRNPKLREDLAAEAARLAREKYDASVYLSKLEKLYESLQPSTLLADKSIHTIRG